MDSIETRAPFRQIIDVVFCFFLSDPQFNLKSSFYFMLFLCDQKVLKESFACKIHLFCIILFSYRNVYFNNRFLKLSPVQQRKGHLDFITFSSFFSGIRHNCWALSLSSPSFPQRASPSSSAATLCHATTGGRGETERKRKRENPWMVGLERERPPKAAAALASSSYSVAARTEEEEEEEVFARAPVSRIFRSFECFSALRTVGFK